MDKQRQKKLLELAQQLEKEEKLEKEEALNEAMRRLGNNGH